jgi:hypothetical protein
MTPYVRSLLVVLPLNSLDGTMAVSTADVSLGLALWTELEEENEERSEASTHSSAAPPPAASGSAHCRSPQGHNGRHEHGAGRSSNSNSRQPQARA